MAAGDRIAPSLDRRFRDHRRDDVNAVGQGEDEYSSDREERAVGDRGHHIGVNIGLYRVVQMAMTPHVAHSPLKRAGTSEPRR